MSRYSTKRLRRERKARKKALKRARYLEEQRKQEEERQRSLMRLRRDREALRQLGGEDYYQATDLSWTRLPLKGEPKIVNWKEDGF